MKINEDLEQKIIYLYKNGYTQDEIVKITGISRKPISNIIVRNGISKYKGIRYNKYIPPDRLLMNIKIWIKNGLNIDDISKKSKLSRYIISNIIKNNKIEFIKEPNIIRKYPIDEYFIDKIDSELKAHFLGFFFADGYNDGNSVSILSIGEIDKAYLDILQNSIQPTKPLAFIKKPKNRPNNQNQYRIEFNSRNFSKKLTEYGAVRNKSLILQFPKNKIDDKFLHHFIRGYFDGDGCISKTTVKHKYKSKEYTYIRHMVNMAGTYNFLYEIKEILNKLGIKSYLCPHKNIYYLYISSRKSIKKFLNYIYNNSSIYLERKYNRYLELLKYKHVRRKRTKNI